MNRKIIVISSILAGLAFFAILAAVIVTASPSITKNSSEYDEKCQWK